jgi:hypothetical protein
VSWNLFYLGCKIAPTTNEIHLRFVRLTVPVVRKISAFLPCLERWHPAWDQFLPNWAITVKMLDAVVMKYGIKCEKKVLMFEIHNSKWLVQGRELTSTEFLRKPFGFVYVA